MTEYTVRAPDGKTITLNGPPGASQADVIAQAQKLYQPKVATPKPALLGPKAVAKDVARSGVAGVGQGVEGIVGTGGDIPNAYQGVLNWVAGKLVDHAVSTGKLSPDMAAGAKSTLARFSGEMTDKMSTAGSLGTRGTILPQRAPTTAQVAGAVAKVSPAVGGALAYQPRTTPGEYARTIGQFAPAALVPGSAGTRVAAVLAPALTSETAGQVARKVAPQYEGGARLAGALAGGFLVPGAARPMPARGALQEAPVSTQAIQTLARRAKPKPADMAARRAEFQKAKIEPALVDVMDDSGRGLVAASANRMTPARQAVTDFRDARALDLPSRMDKQAARLISPDKRNPLEIQNELAATRSTEARQGMQEIGENLVTLDENSIAGLRSDLAGGAIEDAAKNALSSADPEIRNAGAALRDLQAKLLDKPSATTIRVRDAQDISRAMLDAADSAYKSGNGARGKALADLGRAIRTNARTPEQGGFSEYGQWLDRYAENKGLEDALETGSAFMSRNTDQFVQDVGGMSPQELSLAQASARRALASKAGENIGSAPGVARNVALAPEQLKRNQALLGTEGAGALQNAMSLEERLVRNANDVAPRSGSKTALSLQNEGALQSGAQITHDVVSQNWLGLAVRAIKNRGIPDNVAEEIATMAIDPSKRDAAMMALEKYMSTPDAVRVINALVPPKVLVPGALALESNR